MKKFTALLLSAILIIGCFSIVAVSAADESENVATITAGGKTYTANIGDTVTYTVNLKTVHKVTNGEFYLGYNQSVLNIPNDDAFDFPVVNKSTVTYNYNENIQNEFSFNFSNQANPIDFTNGGVLVKISFNVIAAGTCDIGFINEPDAQLQPGEIRKETILSWVDASYIIQDELPNATFTETLTGAIEPTSPTEATEATGSTEATEPTTQAPTQPKVTTIKLTTPKSTIHVTDTITLKVTVTNKVGTTTFKSSNTKVATVSSAGKVTGKSAGSVTITAKNNGKSASVKIKVIKKANTITVKGSSKTLKYSVVKKKAQTFKAVTVKNAKGTVTYGKKSGNGKITVNKKTGKITVKKGLKKGKYTVKVNVTAAGNTTYTKVTKVATVKIIIK